MAIKKTTSAKKSDPPSKKNYKPWNPDSMLTGKDFGKGGKSTYYYMEGGPGGGPIKRQKDMPSLDPKKTIGQVEKEAKRQASMYKGLDIPTMYKSYVESQKAKSNANNAARKTAASKKATKSPVKVGLNKNK